MIIVVFSNPTYMLTWWYTYIPLRLTNKRYPISTLTNKCCWSQVSPWFDHGITIACARTPSTILYFVFPKSLLKNPHLLLGRGAGLRWGKEWLLCITISIFIPIYLYIYIWIQGLKKISLNQTHTDPTSPVNFLEVAPFDWEHADLHDVRSFLRNEIHAGRYVPTLNLPL